MWKFISLAVLSLVSSTVFISPAFAQATIWRSFTTNDGLPSNAVTTIAQTTDGVLWVGTEKGLVQYFNQHFNSNFSQDRLKTDVINDLLADPGGGLWVAAEGGLFYRGPDGNWKQEIQENETDFSGVQDLLLAKNGILWAGGEMGLYYRSGGRWYAHPALGTTIYVKTLAEDAHGKIWLAEKPPGFLPVHVVDIQTTILSFTDNPIAGPHAEINDLAETANGDVWAASDQGLIQFMQYAPAQVYTQTYGLGSSIVTSLLPNPEGGLWVGTAAGLDWLDQGQIKYHLTSQDGLAGDTVRALATDSEGNLWVGTSQGLTRLPLGSWWSERYPQIASIEVKNVLLGSPGRASLALPTGIAQLTDTGNWKILPPPRPGQLVYVLVKDPQGVIWVGTNYGLWWLQGESWQVDQRLPRDLSINALLLDQQGTLWAGSSKGLYRLSKNQVQHFGVENGALRQNGVISLWQTRAGDLWVGTANGGASRLSNGRWAFFNKENTGGGLGNDYILAGLEDQAGNLWFATLHGVDRLAAGHDPYETKAWEHFRQPMLSSDQINALWEDLRHPEQIWVGGDGGLNYIANDQVSTFGVQDGLSHKVVNTIGQEEKNGRLWIGTQRGLTYHFDANISPIIQVPILRVNNEICGGDCQTEGIPYNTGNVTIAMQASDLGDLEGVRYRVVVTPTQSSLVKSIWITDTAATNLTIPISETSLFAPPIRYQIVAQAYDRSFNHSDFTEAITLPVNPPSLPEWLAKTPAALAGLILILASISTSSMYFGVKAYQRRQLYTFPVRLDVWIELVINELNVVKWVAQSRGMFFRVSRQEGKNLLGLAALEQAERYAEQVRLKPGSSGEVIRQLGDCLRQVLFDGSEQELNKAGVGNNEVHLQLHLPVIERLRSLPWEFLRLSNDPNTDPDTRLSFVRDLQTTVELDQERPPWERKQPKPRSIHIDELKVLVAWANPIFGNNQLTLLEYETSEIEQICQTQRKKNINFESIPEATWNQFEAAVRQGSHIVHFSGHGGILNEEDYSTAQSGLIRKNVLLFQGSDGYPHPISQERLVQLFRENQSRDYEHRTCLVILNSCQSAIDMEGMRGLAEALVQDAGVPAVIGMGYKITETSAVDFACEFYKKFFEHGQVDVAVREGRLALMNRRGKQLRDWGVPRLYTQAMDDQLFIMN